MTEEYRAYLAHKKISPPIGNEDFLAHYGVKGQKWGVRNYQYADGGYTPAGAERYWGGTGQGRRTYAGSPRQRMAPGTRSGPVSRTPQRSGIRTVNGSSGNGSKQLTPEQQAARRARAKKVLGVTAGIAVAAALGYAAYKGSTNLRDKQRAEVYKNFNTDWRNANTLRSKYWDTKDRAKYNELSKKRANDVANGITRRDALAAKLYEKTGVRVAVPRSRKTVLEERRSAMEYSNFIRDAERRGEMNKRISDARKELKDVQRQAQRAASTRFASQEKRYGATLNAQWDKQIQNRKQILDDLLLKRRNG